MYPNAPAAHAPAPVQPTGDGGIVYGQAPWHDPSAMDYWRSAPETGGEPDPRLMAASFRQGSPGHQAVLERHGMAPPSQPDSGAPPLQPQQAAQPPQPAPAGPSGYDQPAYGVMGDFTESSYAGAYYTPQFGVAPAPSGAALWRGMPKGAAVGLWQRFLMHQGISVGPRGEDNDYGSATERGTKAFQAAHGLPQTGWVGEAEFEKAIPLGYGPGLPAITPSQMGAPPQSTPTSPGGWPSPVASATKEGGGLFRTALAVGLGVLGAILIWMGFKA